MDGGGLQTFYTWTRFAKRGPPCSIGSNPVSATRKLSVYIWLQYLNISHSQRKSLFQTQYEKLLSHILNDRPALGDLS